MSVDPTPAATKAYRSRVGLVADSPQFPGAWNEIVEKVKIADELGFDSVWLGESWGYELFTSLADLARVTRRIKLGAGIANIYSRTPALIASTVATLDERSGGRMILGLGPSGANVIEHWHGVPFEKPLQRTREYVEIIRMILRHEKLVYHGQFFKLERGFKLRFTPLRADVPIYVAAMGPKNVIQTGEIADGVLPVYWPGHKWQELRQHLDEGAQRAGRPPHSALIAPYITSVILPENADEQMRQAARYQAAAPLAYYIGKMGVYYAEMLTRHGYGTQVQAVIEGWKQGMKSAIEAVDPDMLDAVSIVGTPREIVAKLDLWAERGVDQPLLSMPGGSVDEAGQLLSALMEALRS
ncbi:MAG: LLM class flavin-dependent oxidoreductase [Thermogemmatispora sp.]|uniref:LLM class flavin-dependent oxidoreductase n=1 Tax=Thermogemmatispora sp. TaxID=1968838 RepID=UPI0019FE9006|nr:LLM class flavin-dependent oxidoreductase [Thermogemmatispora sp.]MBE3565306.1 LLM class flavin-dependent oxidoreductase [Thermogemmatispora sp.]